MLKASEKYAGRTVKCPACQTPLVVPHLEVVRDTPVKQPEVPPRPKLKTSAKPVATASVSIHRASSAKPPASAAKIVTEPTDDDAFDPFAESATPTPEPDGDSDQEFAWDSLDLSDRSKTERGARTSRSPRRPIKKRLSDEDNVDEILPKKPLSRRKASKDSAEVPAGRVLKTDSQKPRKASRDAERAGSWRDHLHWVLALALIPLAISLLSQTDTLKSEIERAIQENPELELAGDKDELLDGLPNGRLTSAHLARDSLMHWVYAFAATLLFFGLLAGMFPGAKSTKLSLLWSGLATGTIGIVLLIFFQFIALVTRGVMIRGRGWVMLLFLVVKFIGFSYECASDPENGFLVSFMGFTCGVGLCEELCKALPIIFYINATKKPEWRGACLVGMASGVGFGISEGIMYASDSYNGIAPVLIYFVRFLSCVTLHAIWSGSVALRMQQNTDYLSPDWDWQEILMFVVNYLTISMVLHGLYDTLLKQEQNAFALLVAIASFGWWIWQLRQVES